MTPVARSELPGMEFDWLGMDTQGRLGQFLSTGLGYVPDAALSSEEDLFALLLWLDEQPLREPLSIPGGSFEALLAVPQRRGLYVYDARPDPADPDRRVPTYRLVAAPVTPLRLDELPAQYRGIVAPLPFEFGDVVEVQE